MLLAQRGPQLGRGYTGGAQLSNHYSRCRIGQYYGIAQARSGRGGQRQDGKHGIACASHVKNLPPHGATFDSRQAYAFTATLSGGSATYES